MPAHRLNAKLLEKMTGKIGHKRVKYIREQISKRASRLNISSTAAQLIWAKNLGIGISSALAQAPSEVRNEVRTMVAAIPKEPATQTRQAVRTQTAPITSSTIRALIRDPELYGRCRDLLRAPRHFDRVIREATTVLDDRIKKKTKIQNLSPQDLVGKAINPRPDQAIIEISSNRAEQEGFHCICKGIMLAFRNKAHHSLSDTFTREDAVKFCGFVDTVLGMIELSTIHHDRA
jgi:hypothetical protein